MSIIMNQFNVSFALAQPKVIALDAMQRGLAEKIAMMKAIDESVAQKMAMLKTQDTVIRSLATMRPHYNPPGHGF